MPDKHIHNMGLWGYRTHEQSYNYTPDMVYVKYYMHKSDNTSRSACLGGGTDNLIIILGPVESFNLDAQVWKFYPVHRVPSELLSAERSEAEKIRIPKES